MKKKFILIPVIGVFLWLSLSSYWYGPAYGGLGDLTSSSGVTGGCSCHSSQTTSTSVTVSLLNSGGTAVTSYVPGTTYRLKIHAVNNSSSTLPNFGFQMTVVKSSGAGTGSAVSAGTFGTASSGTHVQAVGSINVFEHYNAGFGDGSIAASSGSGAPGSTYDTSISWTAPSAGTGNVVIYGIANLVNHDGAAGPPDQWNYASTVNICEAASISGTLTVCAGATTNLTASVTGGTWASASTGVATVGTNGAVSGVSGGTAVISYTTSCGTTTATVTVNAVSPGNSVAGGSSPVVCAGSSIVLSNINPGGTWSSTTGSVASVSGGTVSGLTSGTSVISYTLPTTGCAATTTVTVNAQPTISGTVTVCTGLTTTLSATPSGGTWSSTSGLVTVGSSNGVITGNSAGNPVITYTSTSGCTKTITLTVNATPAAIGGTASVCQGATTALTDATPAGVWASGATSVATLAVSGSTATVSGVFTGSPSPATSVITYTAPNSCTVTATVTVNPLPAGISPSPAICVGGSTTLIDGTPGGTWTSASTSVATVVGTTGSVSGAGAGTSIISYTLGTGCAAVTTVTVNGPPPVITGTFNVCPGATTTLSDADPSGGTWTSGSTSVATVGPSSGVVTGLSGVSTSVITFTDAITHCSVSAIVTVNAASSPITGTVNLCPGGTSTLSDASGSGTWSSNATGIATVTSPGASVTLTAVSAGTSVIIYTPSAGCGATVTVTVNPLPGPFVGSASVCLGGTSTLSDPTTPGGSWSSVSTGVATIGSSSGTINGASLGTSIISYVLPTGCSSSVIATVNPVPAVAPVTGTLNVCAAATTTLNDATLSGTWSSSNTSVATVGSSSGTVSGVPGISSASTAIITYTVANSFGCAASSAATVTVNPTPNAIGGITSVCAGSTRILSESTTGGTWSSNATGVATITPFGLSSTVTGVGAGVATISYTSAAGCASTTSFTVNSVPVVGPITGSTIICLGQTSPLADTTAGGVWTSSSPIASVGSGTGIVTGSSLGSANITYSVTSGGCTSQATTPVTVNTVPGAISGPSSVCIGSTIHLSDGVLGGTWSSGSAGIAGVGTSGTVTGVSAGTAVISYSLSAGCPAIDTITVNTPPSAISGNRSLCVGLNDTLSDVTPSGTWTSSNTSLATVDPLTGIVTGVSSGSPTISYTANGCAVTAAVTVNPLSPVTGHSSACSGATTTLSDATLGGTWSSSVAGVAGIGSTGLVTAGSTGTSVITYMLPTGCAATLNFTVISAPSSISGSNQVCLGFTSALTDAGGGTWSSSLPFIASVGSTTGIVTGVALGTTAVITYSLGSGCITTLPVTVNALPSFIFGSTYDVCVGSGITLADATTGGTWSTTSANISVGGTGGLVTGITAGAATVSYTSTLGCSVTHAVTVNPVPLPISGPSTVCEGSSTTLTEGPGSGTWSSNHTGTASVNPTTGSVTGVAAGTASIAYTFTGTGCAASLPITVNALPAGITGSLNVCPGLTTALADTSAGGTWTATPAAIATVSSSGVVSGVATGLAIVSYTLGTGCARTATVAVNALPTPFTVTGGGPYCAGSAGVHIGVTGSQTGVTYHLLNGVSTAGTLTGTGSLLDFGLLTAAGTYAVIATNTAGCTDAMTGSVPVSVNPAPAAISGAAPLCQGQADTLTDTTTGGTWSSTVPAIASVSSTGTVTALTAGTATISYTFPATGCAATSVVTVNVLPSAISGPTSLCIGSLGSLTDLPTGGTWVSATTSVAAIGSGSGTITPVSAGVSVVSYTLPTGCMAATTITVNAATNAGAITGPSSTCLPDTIALADTITGGTWSSSNTSVATVNAAGVVSSVSAGGALVYYTVTGICGTATATLPVTINPLPTSGSISGTSQLCVGTSPTFLESVPGGTWRSSNTSVASVGAGSGIVTTSVTGTDSIVYTVTTVCGTASSFILVTVNPVPTAGSITGADSVCTSDTLHLADAVAGGVWTASNTNALVAGGLVVGLTAGTDTIRYSVTNACGTATTKLPVTIKGTCKTGIEPVPAASDGFKVYPNPSGGSFTVEIPEVQGTAIIKVTDVMGREIQTKVADGAALRSEISLGNVAPGNYFVNVYAGGQVYRAKMVIW